MKSPTKNIIAIFLKIILPLAACCLLLGIAFTGHSPKSYIPLTPNDALIIGEQQLSIQEVAKKYAPHIIAIADFADHEPDWVWYEARKDGNNLRIAYFPAWRNEQHPNILISNLYAAWRYLYYGAVRDIEHIAISINVKNGAVNEVEFESPGKTRFGFVEHDKISLPDDDERTIALTPIESQNTPTTAFRIASWNHLFETDTIQIGEAATPQPRLEYLDDNAYAHYKMERRSKPLWMQ